MSRSTLNEHLAEQKSLVEAALLDVLNRAEWPSSLKTAVEYSLMAGGKRLRPVLVLLSAELCGGTSQDALPAACAIEMIHTYSLIHDDLPAMDDDDYRRGRLTSHKVFGEAMAILAGDCLLTTAFETIAASPLEAVKKAELLRILAKAAGGSGMVGGQILDLEAERGSLTEGKPDGSTDEVRKTSWKTADSAVSGMSAGQNSESTTGFPSNCSDQNRVDHLTRIHTMKTGALIAASLELGAISGGATELQREQLQKYGYGIGLAFQIADDLLDVTGDDTRLGKETGRDADLGKLTYPGLIGIEASRHRALELVVQACAQLDSFGEKSVWLKELARFIVERDH